MNLVSFVKKEITPLHCAAAKGHTDVCKRLIQLGANINSQNHVSLFITR